MAFFQSPLLEAQVVFSRPKGPIVESESDRNRVKSYAGLSVSYFDSTAVVKSKDPNNQTGFEAIDSILGKTTDSLIRISTEDFFSGRTATRLELIPAIPPVRLLTWQNYRVSSRFGWRQHPIGGDIRLHNGIDLPQSAGTPVFATADGVVKWNSWQPNGLGLALCLEHPTGYQTIYGHLSNYAVREGNKVRRGALIGRVGSTGRSTGPHLHYTILYRGKPVDPARYCFLWMKMARIDEIRSARMLEFPARRNSRNRIE